MLHRSTITDRAMKKNAGKPTPREQHAQATTNRLAGIISGVTPLSALRGDDHAIIVITQPGAYVLTADLRAVAGKAGIRIDADNVTLDLGGHTLQGVEGSLDGVTVTTVAANITVRNGDVRGWGQDGVDLSNAIGSCAQNLRLFDNGGFGLLVGSGARITDCTMDRNRGYGGAAWNHN